MWLVTGLHFYVVNFCHLICSELLFQNANVQVLLPTSFCSHLVPGTVMTAINVSFNSIIIAYGLEHALAKRIIAVFGEFIMWFSLSLYVPFTCTVVAYAVLQYFFLLCVCVCVCVGGGGGALIDDHSEPYCVHRYIPFLWQKVRPILWTIYVVCQ